jgi:universal stress protein E
MTPIKNILLVVDPGLAPTPAHERAVDLAKACDAALHLCLAEQRPVSISRAERGELESLSGGYLAPRRHWLEEIAAVLNKNGVRTTFSADWGRPADIVIGKVFEMKSELVIKDMRTGHAVQRALRTGLDWQLLRACPASTMLVSGRYPEVKRIVAAVDPMHDDVDGGDTNRRILETALDFGMRCGSAVHSVHVFETLLGSGGVLNKTYARIHDEMQHIHRQAYDQLMDAHRIPPDRRHFVPAGVASAAILDFVDQLPCDLLVLGTSPQSTMAQMLMGNTAEDVLCAAHCDVLVVKSWAHLAQCEAVHRARMAA